MSLCTLIENKNKILQYHNQINNLSKSHYSNWQTVAYIISNLIKTQWHLRRKYYNKNMLIKHKFSSDVCGREYLNCLFQHIYNHGHSALTDEIFEVIEAKDKYVQYDRESGYFYDLPDNYYDNAEGYTKDTLSLYVEELIDCLFFIVEQTSWLETHFQLMLSDDNYNSGNISYYLNDYNMFSDRIKMMITEEGSHITQYIYDNKPLIRNSNIDNNLFNLMSENRNFLRLTNWKDWKEYSIDYYNPAKFGEMFKKNRELYIIILQHLYNVLDIYVKLVLEIDNYNQKEHISDMFKVIYAIFNTKAEENQRRQMEDPRYKLNNNGEVKGVNV